MINTKDAKKILFRLNSDDRTALKIIGARNNLGTQHLMQAAVEVIISDYYPDTRAVIINMAKGLKSEN